MIIFVMEVHSFLRGAVFEGRSGEGKAGTMIKSNSVVEMNKRLLVLGVLFVLLVLLHLSSREGFAGSEGTQVIIAKADWCGHCRKAMPEFEKLASASPLSLPDGSQAVVKMVDADKDKAEMSALDVKGFPTILVMKGGKRHEYGGERTYSGVVDFLRSL